MYFHYHPDKTFTEEVPELTVTKMVKIKFFSQDIMKIDVMRLSVSVFSSLFTAFINTIAWK